MPNCILFPSLLPSLFHHFNRQKCNRNKFGYVICYVLYHSVYINKITMSYILSYTTQARLWQQKVLTSWVFNEYKWGHTVSLVLPSNMDLTKDYSRLVLDLALAYVFSRVNNWMSRRYVSFYTLLLLLSTLSYSWAQLSNCLKGMPFLPDLPRLPWQSGS